MVFLCFCKEEIAFVFMFKNLFLFNTFSSGDCDLLEIFEFDLMLSIIICEVSADADL